VKALTFIYRSSITIVTLNHLGESFIMLTAITEHDTLFECRSKWKHLLEFNDFNIHLYVTLNYGMALEHL